MTHLQILEWGRVAVDPASGQPGFSRQQANRLLDAARAHPLGGTEGTRILSDHHRHLTARQVVGMLAGKGCSLEILPKLDGTDEVGEGETGEVARRTIRDRLIHMLDIAVGLDISSGAGAAMARQNETLLDVLIRLFADRLLAEARRGLPRQYNMREDDLPALRGRLDPGRQFTVNAVRPDRLACRFDELEADTPLLRIMKACVLSLLQHARALETQRKLAELRFMLADIPDVPRSMLPWDRVRIDRSNRRWRSLFAMARLFLRREWQATHRDGAAPEGITLLFAMNDLFEAYVAAQLRRALADTGAEVVVQGGLKYCLGDWVEGVACEGSVFQTRPDILIRRKDKPVVIVDTKWKQLATDPLDRKRGVSQADVYQMMAYARLYRSPDLTLIYPALPGAPAGERKRFGIAGGDESLRLVVLEIAQPDAEVRAELRRLFA